MRLTGFPGSMWRGVWGRQLRLMSDGKRSVPADLSGWITREKLYEYFMETPPPPQTPAMRCYTHVPHPYALACGWRQQELIARKGEFLRITLKLFGRANELLPVALLAFARAGQDGLGPRRAKARLEKVVACRPDPHDTGKVIFVPGAALRAFSPSPPAVPARMPPQTRVVLELKTPLRLQQQGRILTPATFTPYPLLMNLVRRACMLRLFHGAGEIQLNFKELKEQAKRAQLLDHALHWVEVKRYSARQQREVPISGLMGRMRLDMSQAADLLPFLHAGQYVQAGKGTVFGLGQFQVRI